MYQLLHAVALLSISNSSSGPGHRAPSSGIMSGGRLMFLGTTLFSGSIYLLTLDIGPKRLFSGRAHDDQWMGVGWDGKAVALSPGRTDRRDYTLLCFIL